ncbi:Survivin-1 [Operophtera brumata]|uniref:Survivin-1 n=1 Tax=Operophtera brumata TaxID=104452 RepID=A0A0L7LQQ7_OPEBR|nr:Survivin-1 [Operophtera brumata]
MYHILLTKEGHFEFYTSTVSASFQLSANRRSSQGGNGGVVGICCAVRALCRHCPEVSVRTYLQWLEGSAPPAPSPDPALAHTLAAVLWILQSKQSMENLHELITDDLFELVYHWVNMVPESKYLEIPMDQDESMEGLTDDTKVHSSPRLEEGPSDAHVAWRIPAQRLFTAARAAMFL